MNTIFRRRSIRRYTGEEVSSPMVEKLLKAGMCAPSAGNERPWHFIVVRDQGMLGELAGMSPYAKMVADAAVAIAVCGDLDLEKHKGFWVQDCAAATQNILLEAEELKLGAVWLGVYPVPDRVDFLKKAFCLPESVIAFALIAIGHPAEKKECVERYDGSRVHREKW